MVPHPTVVTVARFLSFDLDADPDPRLPWYG